MHTGNVTDEETSEVERAKSLCQCTFWREPFFPLSPFNDLGFFEPLEDFFTKSPARRILHCHDQSLNITNVPKTGYRNLEGSLSLHTDGCLWEFHVESVKGVESGWKEVQREVKYSLLHPGRHRKHAPVFLVRYDFEEETIRFVVNKKSARGPKSWINFHLSEGLISSDIDGNNLMQHDHFDWNREQKRWLLRNI